MSSEDNARRALANLEGFARAQERDGKQRTLTMSAERYDSVRGHLNDKGEYKGLKVVRSPKDRTRN